MSKAFNIATNLGAYQSAFDSSGDLTAPNITTDSVTTNSVTTDNISAANNATISNNALVVDASGNVGIGDINTEGYKLEVVSDNAANNLMVHKKNVTGTGSATNIAMQVTQTNGQSARLAEIGADFVSGWGGSLHFATKSDNGTPNNSTTERMRIHEGGEVTMPYQPICSATHSLSVSLSNVELDSSNFYDTIWVNRGGHFNSSNGRFTCPVAGVYRIYFRATGSGNSNVRLRKNGVTVNEAYESTGTNHSVSSEAVVSCVAGDYLNIQVANLSAIGGTQHKQVTFELIS